MMENNNKLKPSKSIVADFISMSLQKKILLPFLILIICTGGIISFVSYSTSVKNTTDELSKSVENQMLSMNDTFEMFFKNMGSTLERFSQKDLLLNYNPNNKREILELFKETKHTDSSIVTIYTGTDTGEMIIYPAADLGEDYKAKERPWFKDAVEARGEIVWTDPYIDASTGETVVTAAKAYYNGNKLAGVMSADVFVSTLIEMIDNITIGETGFAVILDQSGNLIAHPNKEKIGKDESGEDYYKKILKSGEQGLVEYKIKGEDAVMGFSKNPTTGWILGGTVNVKDFQKKAQVIIKPILISLGVILLLAVLVSLIITNRITKPIKLVMERMKLIASGELNHTSLNIRSKDEIGQLVQATNAMNDNMRNLLSQINKVSETVSAHSEELSYSANEVKEGSDQIASTMQQLASGSEAQASTASDLTSAMQIFVKQVEEANGNGERIQGFSKEVIQITNQGSQLMASSKEQMSKIDQIVHDSVRKVQGLDIHSQEISELVRVIQEIADQTNLLALNAAIEAARAGEHGKGFAVVADEVRKLAEQVFESVTDIRRTVTNIQNESTTVVTSLRNGYKEVEEGTNQIEVTEEKFNDINIAVMDMVNNISAASENLANIASRSQEMNRSIEEIAAISEESAAGIEQTSASSQQTSAAMEEVVGSSSDLSELAEDLNRLVSRFSL
ncbi:methyl-accepting chemotaxis protein [Virgibacillus sp. LDC-1]|uniref:methyl-accepting chemotaxis protein n=1 Tax=Virgibacillus sp. LDC-1 TaxID=3039856 RepID=UPI0024DE6591|nr:methyl-accepting chemotaxis protein [Virgibacillus sp. LDC-1]